MTEHSNEGQFRVYHDGLTGINPKLGCVNMEVNPTVAIQRVKDRPCITLTDAIGTTVTYDQINYIEGYPKDCMEYSEVLSTKYYWNTVHKLLYKRDKRDQNPWSILDVTIEYVDGIPEELILNPSEDIIYCDSSVSSRELQLYKWSEKNGWSEYMKMVQLIMSPTMLGYDPEKTDYHKLYYDMQKHDLYKLDPFVFMVEVGFTSDLKNLDKYLIYEGPLACYDELNTKSFDITNETRIDFKDIIFISKDPTKYVEEPKVGKYYRDVKENKWYTYDGAKFTELKDKNVTQYGEPIYVKGVPSSTTVVETPKTNRPYINILSGIIYMYQNGTWVKVGTTELSTYHPSKDFY